MRPHERLSRGWASLLSAIGYAVVALGVIAAVLPWLGVGGLERQLPSVNVVVLKLGLSGALVLAGLAVGAPFVVAGALLRIGLDQRKLLARIDRRLAAFDTRSAEPERGSPLVERLRPRG